MVEDEDALIDRQVAPTTPPTSRLKMKLIFLVIVLLSLGALLTDSIYESYFSGLDQRAETLQKQIDSSLGNEAAYKLELKKYLAQDPNSTSSNDISENRAEWLKKFIDVENRLVVAREKLLAAVLRRNYLEIFTLSKMPNPIIEERIKLLDKQPSK